MKVKIYVVDMELSPRARRIARRVLGLGALSLILVLGGTIAWGAVPKAWIDGDVLTAKDLNDNFNALDARAATLESTVAGQATQLAGLPALADNPTSGYVRIGSTQIVWGKVLLSVVNGDGNSEYITVSMPVSFADTSFVVQATPADVGQVAAYGQAAPSQTSSIKLQYVGASNWPTASRSLNWMAIGRWK